LGQIALPCTTVYQFWTTFVQIGPTPPLPIGCKWIISAYGSFRLHDCLPLAASETEVQEVDRVRLYWEPPPIICKISIRHPKQGLSRQPPYPTYSQSHDCNSLPSLVIPENLLTYVFLSRTPLPERISLRTLYARMIQLCKYRLWQ
jgi:hypothetical protein